MGCTRDQWKTCLDSPLIDLVQCLGLVAKSPAIAEKFEFIQIPVLPHCAVTRQFPDLLKICMAAMMIDLVHCAVRLLYLKALLRKMHFSSFLLNLDIV